MTTFSFLQSFVLPIINKCLIIAFTSFSLSPLSLSQSSTSSLIFFSQMRIQTLQFHLQDDPRDFSSVSIGCLSSTADTHLSSYTVLLLASYGSPGLYPTEYRFPISCLSP